MNIIGANWKTTVSGIGAAIFALVSVLATLPYELGDAGNIFPPAYKAKIAVVGAIAALMLRVWNSFVQKDRNVTGGTIQQDADKNVAARQEPTPLPPAPAVPSAPFNVPKSTLNPQEGN